MAWAAPLRAQDQANVPPPPDAAPTMDNGAPAPEQDNGAPPPPPDNGTQQAPSDNGGQDQGVSFQTFYDSLGTEGTWIQTNDYGYVWQPQVNDPNWAPYTQGHWAYSDDGWTWVSDEPWGWATYHYGRWVNIDGTGWCWVPGYTWAPAWVSWRYGDGYAGWAPLPPDSLIGVDYDGGDPDDGFHIGGDCDSYYGIGAGWYTFLPIAYLGERDYRGYYSNRRNNFRLINRTTNVTNLNLTRNTGGGRGRFAGVSLGGPSLLAINASAQTPISRVNLVNASRAGGGSISGNSLAIFAPRVNVGTARSARPQSVGGSLANANVNHGTDFSRPLRVNSHINTVAPTQNEILDAQSAQASAPAQANLAPRNETVRTFSTPLTSMRPTTFPSDRPSTYNGGVVRNVQSYSGSGQAYRPSGNAAVSGGAYRGTSGAASSQGQSSGSYSGGGGYHGGGGGGGGGSAGGSHSH